MHEILLNVDEYTVHLYYEEGDKITETSIREAKLRGSIPLVGLYSADKHAPRASTEVTQYHLHIYKKQNEIFAINKDGTAHDQSHGKEIPKKVANAISSLFPDYKLPPNNIIESYQEELTTMELNFMGRFIRPLDIDEQ